MRPMVLLLLVLGLASAGRGETPTAVDPRDPLPPGRVEVLVEDLHCATCVKKVARKLYALKGVKKVTGTVSDDLVVVALPANQEVPVAALWSAVEAGGVKPLELRYLDLRLDAEAVAPLLAEAKEKTTR